MCFQKIDLFNGMCSGETDPLPYKYAAKCLITYINPFSTARGVFSNVILRPQEV